MSAYSTSGKNRISGQIVWISIALAAFMAVACGVSSIWAAGRIDGLAVVQEKAAIEEALLDARLRFGQLPSGLRDGDSILRQGTTDLDKRLTSRQDIDYVYIVSPTGEVLRASNAGTQSEHAYLPAHASKIGELVKRLRQQVEDIGFDDPSLVADGGTGLQIVETVRFQDGQIAFVNVRPVKRLVDAGPAQRATGLVVVSIRVVTHAMIRAIGEGLEVQNLHRSDNAQGAAALPIFDTSGRSIAVLNWNPARPAEGLIREAAPALVFLVLSGGVLMAGLLTWLRRISVSLETSQNQATYLSKHDPLTGLANRTLFEEKLLEAKSYRSLAETKVMLVCLDVDHFKSVNDTWGHNAGDQLLTELARRLQIELPEEATVARLGGDEFAIVHPGVVSDGQASWICNRLLRCAETPFMISQRPLHATLSMGVTRASAEELVPQELVRQADVALYSAKTAGRNRFAHYDPEMDRQKRDRRILEVELRDALLNGNGLGLAYQPIYFAASRGIAGAEALVRWDHPTRGKLSPELFVALAEECGIIDQLGEWVLREAARFAVASSLPRIAVNFSPIQFRDDRLAERILRIIGEEGLEPHRLEVEITEGMLLQDSPEVQRTLVALRSAGARIALDDFGTGYSSISYLRKYAVDKLKIDQSFTRQIGEDDAVSSIISLVIGTAHALGMSVTAEGVESAAQANALREMGCDRFQGYHFARPQSPEQLVELLNAKAGVRQLA